VEQCFKLLNDFLSEFKLSPRFTTTDEFAHWILTREGVVYSYVVEDPETNSITDFLSFYSLPSTIIKHETYSTLNAAYCFYCTNTKASITNLMNDALILAKSLDFDVFNALDIMHNSEFLKELKFGIGDGHLQYYMYNWKCRAIKAEEVGLVLL